MFPAIRYTHYKLARNRAMAAQTPIQAAYSANLTVQVDSDLCIYIHVVYTEGESLLNHLNSVRTTIKFTMDLELERDGSLPFLDTKLTRREGGALDVTVFRKPTHTDRYLHFSSHHPASANRAAVRSLFDRARNVTLWKENLREEEEHLTTTFKQNGYPLPFIRAISSSIQEPPTPPEEEEDEEPDDEGSQEDERKLPLAVIPYVSGVSERIRKACSTYGLSSNRAQLSAHCSPK